MSSPYNLEGEGDFGTQAHTYGNPLILGGHRVGLTGLVGAYGVSESGGAFFTFH